MWQLFTCKLLVGPGLSLFSFSLPTYTNHPCPMAASVRLYSWLLGVHPDTIIVCNHYLGFPIHTHTLINRPKLHPSDLVTVYLPR